MFPRWRTRWIEQTLLCKQHKWLLGMLTAPDRSLTRRYFRQRSAEMHRRGTRTFLRLPGNGAIQCQVKLENARPIAIALQPALVSGRQARTCDAQQLPGSDIAQHNVRGRKHL